MPSTAKPVARDPFVIVASVLGVFALGMVVVGLVTGTQAPFVAVAVATIALWFVSTIHHVRATSPAPSPALGAH